MASQAPPSATEDTSKRVKVEGALDDIDTSATFAWARCDDKEAGERIIIKEHAVEKAQKHISQLCELLRKHAKDDESPGAQSLQDWFDLVGKCDPNQATHIRDRKETNKSRWYNDATPTF